MVKANYIICRKSPCSYTTMIHLTFSLLGLFYSLAECQLQNATLPIRLPSTAPTNSSTCPLLNDSAQREVVRKTLDSYYSSDNRPCSCGYARSGTRAVYLNMSDPNQQCPSNWTLITTPIRGCGRRNINAFTCDSVTYSVHNRTYSSVCGRILAYQRGYSAALYAALLIRLNTIEEPYLSGVSLTHGPAGSRKHIWSFVGTEYEQSQSYRTYYTCSCTNTNVSWTRQVPSFINNDYFCDTGNPGPGVIGARYYTDDPLWDGKGCSSTSTCCEFNTPPWFCKSLPQPTSDDLEIRHCYGDLSPGEDKLITLIEIYIK